MADAMKLLPCPFCGGKASIERFGNTRVSTQYSCDDCGCFLETGEEFNHGRAWNRRASPPAREEAPAEGAGEMDRAALTQMAQSMNLVLSGSWAAEQDCDWESKAAETKLDRLDDLLGDLLAALRNRTSEPEAGAVAWRVVWSNGTTTTFVLKDRAEEVARGRSVQPLFTHPAPATADKLRADIETALKNFDATSAMCPFNKSPTPPRDKPCPTCSAEKNEGCRREITAAFGFVYVARQALATLNEEGK